MEIRKWKITAITKEMSCLRERFKDLSISSKSEAICSNLSIDYCRHLRERLEIWSEFSSVFIFFVHSPHISDTTLTVTKQPETGFGLWYGHHRVSERKNSILAICSLSKYTWEIILYIVLTGKRRWGPDIWPETAFQVKNIVDMMTKIWAIEAYFIFGER